jgi:hypothetical protein
MMKTVFAALAATFLAIGAAHAGDGALTEDQAKRFVKTLPALDEFGKELEKKEEAGKINFDAQPKAGEPFKPYSNAVKILKAESPADHQRLASLVKPHGFSATQWGDVGDRVMIAYMALKMQEEDPRTMQMMEGMDKSMMDMMPPEMKAQMEAAFAMMETVKNAPEADKQAVSSVKADLDAYMEQSGES